MSLQTDFINSIKEGARQGQAQFGVLASLTIAQAIWESGWGRYALENNIFGIKAQEGYTGTKKQYPTQEWDGTQYITIMAWFRTYPSIEAGMIDHGLFLTQNSRYANIIGVTDYALACRLIQQDGYATDPTYAQSLIGVIEQYGLNVYDNVEYTGGTGTIQNSNTTIRGIQEFLNAIKSKDQYGQALIIDGVDGTRTQASIQNAKTLINSLLL